MKINTLIAMLIILGCILFFTNVESKEETNITDCGTLKCSTPKCSSGYMLAKRENQCCPSCQLDCKGKTCPPIRCKQGWVPFRDYETSCCQQCKQDCRLVKCAKPESCPGGQEPIKDPLECCYKCPDLN